MAKRGKRAQLMGGLVLLTLGALFILDRLIILEIDISWPLILVTIGIGLFLSNPHSLSSWVVGGIGVILFLIKFVIAFFPEVEAWSDLVWPTILVIIGVLLLYRYYKGQSPPTAPTKMEDRGTKGPVKENAGGEKTIRVEAKESPSEVPGSKAEVQENRMENRGPEIRTADQKNFG